jgi:hypothetical protein
MKKSSKSRLYVSATLMLTAVALSAPGQIAQSLHLDFVTHAAFFSGETRQPWLVVSDSSRRRRQGRRTFKTWQAFARHLLTRIRRQLFFLTPGERRWDLTFGSG